MNAWMRRLLSALLPQAYKPFTMFPYPYVGTPREILTGRTRTGFPFAQVDDLRICFPKDDDVRQVEECFRGYLEDEGLTGLGRRTKSPHCYVQQDHRPESGDVVVDVGCSEGFFSRSYVHEAKRVYLFEAEGKWVAPLQETFGDCPEKVVLVQKYVGAKTEGSVIRLDDAIGSGEADVYFIKMDIEGAEREVLESSRAFLMGHKVKLSCCAYHRPSDGRYLTRLLRKMGFKTRYSDGWMLFFGRWGMPSFRRGMIYARNF